MTITISLIGTSLGHYFALSKVSNALPWKGTSSFPFCWNYFTMAFPLLTFWKKRKLQLYANINCPSCDCQDTENYLHIITCKTRTSSWDLIHIQLKNFLEKKIAAISDFNKILINKTINQIIGKNSCSQVFAEFWTYASKVKIKLETTKVLTKFLRINFLKVKSLLTDLLSTFVSLYKEHIWISRCDDLKDGHLILGFLVFSVLRLKRPDWKDPRDHRSLWSFVIPARIKRSAQKFPFIEYRVTHFDHFDKEYYFLFWTCVTLHDLLSNNIWFTWSQDRWSCRIQDCGLYRSGLKDWHVGPRQTE
jgi:hypothetical protein